MAMALNHCLVLLVCIFRVSADPSVVIIGAGASGVAAATKLLEHNYTDITVLEAEDKIGGRIQSVKFGDGYVDLGARWVQGEKGNVVYELTKDLNLLQPYFVDTDYYHSSKGKVNPTIAKLIDDTFNLCYRNNDKNKEEEHSQHTIAESCTKIMKDTLDKFHTENDDAKKVIKSIPYFIQEQICTYDGSFKWDKLPEVDDYVEFSDEKYFIWNGKGYKTIFDVLIKKFPDPSKQLPFDEKLHLNKEVKKITWKSKRGDDKIKVDCSDGSTYDADYVIFTPSLGVLKDNHKTLFEPRLSHDKENVIDVLGYDAVMVVHFRFPSSWWHSEKFNSFAFLWDDDDMKSLRSDYNKGPTKNNHHWLSEFVYVNSHQENPNVLTAWLAGELIPEIEKLPKDTLIDGFRFLLKKFLGNMYNITKPDDVLKMNWYSNPHFRGTYSYQTIDSRNLNNKKSAEDVLSEPLQDGSGKPKVLFAGEATHPHYFSSVHGAIESGYREAERLMKLMRKN